MHARRFEEALSRRARTVRLKARSSTRAVASVLASVLASILAHSPADTRAAGTDNLQARQIHREPLRSGDEELSPALRALQRDSGMNPAWLWIEQGRTAWSAAAGPTIRTCASCHGPIEAMKVAAAYPRWHEASQRPRALEDQILHCRAHHAGPGSGPDPSASLHDVLNLSLAAALVAASHGQPIRPDPHPGLQTWSTRGQTLWHQRMGQLHLSCAQCHDQRAGQRLGGTRIPQGHDTGYPVYRMEWQSLGPLERRLRGCMTGVRAEPFAPGADEWRALSVYMHRRSAGLPLQAGAIRP